jgi:hypothetical protein
MVILQEKVSVSLALFERLIAIFENNVPEFTVALALSPNKPASLKVPFASEVVKKV